MKRSFYHLWRGTWQVTKTQCVRPSHQCRATSSYFFKTAFGFFWFGHLLYRWNSHTCLQWRFDELGMTSSKACVPCNVFTNTGTVGGDHQDGPQSHFQLPSQWWEAYVYSEDVNCCISPVFGNSPSCQHSPILAPSWLSATSSGYPQLAPQHPRSNRSMAGYHWKVKIRATCCLTKVQILQGPMVTASVCHPRSTPNLRKRISVLVWASLPQAFRIPWCTHCWGNGVILISGQPD